MFDVQVCASRPFVLIRFRGLLAEHDFVRLDQLASSRAGPGYDVIFDMTAVERVDLAADFVAKRGDLPQAFKDRERIYVVPQDDLKLLVRFYAASQAAKGWRAPEIVGTLEEAFKCLGVSASDFTPLAGA
ncbi:MAG: hypothetical protein EPO10_26545 [Reyranella sp.]|nr:MAG: hypothetical protein EPO10_26545 [Reyranella sp.]